MVIVWKKVSIAGTKDVAALPSSNLQIAAGKGGTYNPGGEARAQEAEEEAEQSAEAVISEAAPQDTQTIDTRQTCAMPTRRYMGAACRKSRLL